MKNILIIYPHWPPSNLAGVHRPRLIANFIAHEGWNPIILTVNEAWYEEEPDYDLLKTVAKNVEVIKVNAFPILKIGKYRIIGDIGLRSFWQLLSAAKNLLKNRKIDFIWIPIPSWYTALLGPILYRKVRVPYGIDYIDPWIFKLSHNEKIFSRPWWANKLAHFLEPLAVKNASLITGVSTSYYQPVLDRNFKNRFIPHVGMPYGFDPADHKIYIDKITYPWSKDSSIIPYVYAGAFLPQSYLFIEALFEAIYKLKEIEKRLLPPIRFYFLGTGYYKGTTIAEYAEKKGLSNIVIEIKERLPFLHIQQFLRNASGIIIIGSTEKHYTASKTFQCLLANRPIWAILHEESSAAQILSECKADQYLALYKDDMNKNDINKIVYTTFSKYLDGFLQSWNPNLASLEQYSAKQSAKILVEAIEQIIKK